MISRLISRPVAVSMFYLAVIILGVFSFRNISIEGQPETELPQLVVATAWPNSSPEVVQVFLTSPIEEASTQIEGLQEMLSSSRRGFSQVTLKFNRQTDMEFARLDLNERLSKLRTELPPGASQPQITMVEDNRRVNDRFMQFSISGPYDLERLSELFDDYLRNEISSVDGVADVAVRGERNKALKIRLDRKAMDLYGLVPSMVATKIRALTTNYETSRSHLENQEFTITINNSIPNMAELESLVIARFNDRVVRLADVGQMELGHARVLSYSRLNGNPNVTIAVEKEVGANVIETAREVRQRVDAVAAKMPRDFRVDWLTDNGEMMAEQLDSIYNRAIWCMVLIVLLLLVFLQSVSAAVVITLNILFSVLITVNFMFYFDVTFNIVTLSGLAIGFGMLVDNAIVVLENIFRFREEGLSRSASALAGAKDVLWAILAATLTTVAAFVCMVFLEDRLSVTYWPLALSVIFSLSASMLVSFTFTPLLSLLIRGSNLKSSGKTSLARRLLTHPINYLTEGYGKCVAWTLNHKLLVMVVVVAFSFMFFKIFVEEIDRGGFSFFWNRDDRLGVVVRMPEGAELETADEVIRQFENPLLEMATRQNEQAMSKGYKDCAVEVYSNYAHLEVTFDSDTLATSFPLALKSRLIGIAQGFAGVGLTVYGINSEDNYYSGSTGYETFNSNIQILGYNYKKLMDLAENLLQGIRKNKRVKSTKLQTSRSFGWVNEQTETVLRINREALRQYDIDILYLMSFLARNLQVESTDLTKYRGEEMTMELKFEDADDFDIKALEKLIVKTQNNQQIRLADMVTIEERKVPSGIDRKDQQYMVNVMWDYRGSAKRARQFNEAVFNSLSLPAGYKAELDYSRNLSAEETQNLKFVFILAIIIVFMIIAALYESFVDPFVIFLTIPLSFVGVSWIYWYTGNSFDSTSYIGLVILAGIVVNNSILLVSHINDEVHNMAVSGLTFSEALVKACKDRLRPILLTAITTIVGLLPLLEEFVRWFLHVPLVAWLFTVLGIEASTGNLENSGLQTTLTMFSSLSRSTVGGMLSATFATLLVLPIIYAICFRAKQWIHWRINEIYHLATSTGPKDSPASKTAFVRDAS